MARFAEFALLALATAVTLAACSSGSSAPPTPVESPTPTATLSPVDRVVSFQSEYPDWPRTDFTRSTVDPREILRGCPSRDCIPPLDVPGVVEIPAPRGGKAAFAPASELAYSDRLPVAVVTVDGITKAYPLHILTWHEVVNDRFGERPVVVTFCPLCNTAIAYDRRVGGRVLDFGVSGNLRNSDLIMWDRQTESWWQQASGEAIVGTFAGERLEPLGTGIVAWGEFRRAFPDALALTEETGFERAYGVNPYEFYDATSQPFLFSGEPDPRLPALERVVTLDRAGKGLAVPFEALARVGVANVEAGGAPVAVFWLPGTASALDQREIAQSRDVGSAAAYDARLDGRQLAFEPGPEPGTFRDRETGTQWDIFGRGVSGPLAGRQLTPVLHTTEFWFAWAAFHPETDVWRPEG
ncbi:DUF3179 domain-containing protein [Tepidiforma sp.]|uniref:DUF3179 domain-containing protein n=1 Tax=Tepidiforma sp. TaxID=2682230 RepID=UPI002ADE16D3|nr:DUF3179 domain-containing protein [Tepidiforma sp.]